MTTPSPRQLRPSPPERYEEQCFHSLEQAEEELAKGDARQSSEKIWIAIANALKSVAQDRGWNHRYHNHLRAVAYYLAVEYDRPDWNTNFHSFESMHSNFYEHQIYVDDVAPSLDVAKDYCQAIVNVRRTLPPNWDDFPVEKRRNLESRLTALTRPLPADAAFGPELSDADLADLPPVRPPHIREVNR